MLLVTAKGLVLRLPKVTNRMRLFASWMSELLEEQETGAKPPTVSDALTNSRLLILVSWTKHVGLILASVTFAVLNLLYGHQERALASSGPCILVIPATQHLGLQKTNVHFQCDGKKKELELVLLDLVSAFLLLLALSSFTFLLWLQFLRPMKQLVAGLQQEAGAGLEDWHLEQGGSKDLVLLLDLVAHSQDRATAVNLLTRALPRLSGKVVRILGVSVVEDEL